MRRETALQSVQVRPSVDRCPACRDCCRNKTRCPEMRSPARTWGLGGPRRGKSRKMPRCHPLIVCRVEPYPRLLTGPRAKRKRGSLPMPCHGYASGDQSVTIGRLTTRQKTSKGQETPRRHKHSFPGFHHLREGTHKIPKRVFEFHKSPDLAKTRPDHKELDGP